MSGEAAIVEAVARIAIAVLGPVITEALRGGEPEEQVIARLTALHAPVVRDTAAEDAARRARVAAATLARVSTADVDLARRLAGSAVLSGEERASVLRLAVLTEHALRGERAEDDTRPVGSR